MSRILGFSSCPTCTPIRFPNPVSRSMVQIQPSLALEAGAGSSARVPFLPVVPLHPSGRGRHWGPGSLVPALGVPCSEDCKVQGGWGGLGTVFRCLFYACKTFLA